MMSLKFFLLSIATLSILTLWTHPLNAGNCPPNADPSYCAVANSTGGKVYSGTPEENFKSLEKDVIEEFRTNEREAFIKSLNLFFNDMLNGIFLFSPIFIGFFLLEIFIRTIRDKRIFAASYSISNCIPPFIFYFTSIDAGRGLPLAFSFAGVLFLIASWPIGYNFFKRRVPLYIGVTVFALFTVLPLFMMMSMH